MATYTDVRTGEIISEKEVNKRIEEKVAPDMKNLNPDFLEFLDSEYKSSQLYQYYKQGASEDDFAKDYADYLLENLIKVDAMSTYTFTGDTFKAFEKALNYYEPDTDDILELSKALIDDDEDYILDWIDRNKWD
jgi:hypothetical protein